MGFTFTTPGLGPADYGRKPLGGTYGNMYSPSIAGTSTPSYETIYNKDNAVTGGGGKYGSMYGPISAGLQIAQGVLGYMQAEKQAAAYHESYKDLMLRSGQVLDQGQETAIDIRQEGGRFIGTQISGFGKSGSAFEGSPASVVVETQRRIDLASERVIEQSRRDAAALYRQAKAAKKQAKSARLAGYAQLIGSIGGQAAGSLFNFATSV